MNKWVTGLTQIDVEAWHEVTSVVMCSLVDDAFGVMEDSFAFEEASYGVTDEVEMVVVWQEVNRDVEVEYVTNVL